MILPTPVRGLVVRYEYLWRREAEAGRDTGKDRPACLLLTVEVGDETRVVYCPITHLEPADKTYAVEIPPDEKRRLGLDDLRSWIVAAEINEDLWPKSLRRIPGRHDAFAYGRLSHPILVRVAQRFQAAMRDRALRRTSRD
jgi:mRNA-degrading endonuclease toxin of MazEF toxin-antitoxin module